MLTQKHAVRRIISLTVMALSASLLSALTIAVAPVQAAPSAMTVGFESGESSGYSITPFGGASAVETATPPAGASGRALQFTKGSVENWSGVTFMDLSVFGSLVSPSGIDTVTAQVYGDSGTVVTLKLDTFVDSFGVEIQATKTQSGWETMTWTTVSVPTNSAPYYNAGYRYYDKASFFVNLGSLTGAGSNFLFDNVTFQGYQLYGQPSSAVYTFESGESFTPAFDFGGSRSVEAPPSGGPAGSLQAMKFVSSGNGGVGLVLNSGNDRLSPIISTTNAIVSMNLHSAAGKTIQAFLDVDRNDYSGDNSTVSVTTADSGWQTISFDFSSATVGPIRSKFGLKFPDSGTYYVDNIAINGASTGVLQGPRAFTLTNAVGVTGAYSSAVSGTQTAGPYNFVTLSAPNGYSGSLNSTNSAYLKVTGTTFAASGTNVTVSADQTRADLVASSSATSVDVMYPRAETVTARFYISSSVNGVTTETLTQTISIGPSGPVSDGLVSAAKSTTLLRANYTSWDPSQTADDAVTMGLAGSSSPAYIEGRIRDSLGNAVLGKRVIVSATGPIVFKIRKYESPYSDLSGTGLRWGISDTLTGTGAFVVEVSRDGTGNFGPASVTLSVGDVLIGEEKLTITGPVTGIKGTVSQSIISAGAVGGYQTPNASDTLTTSAIGFVAADSRGSISYDGFEALTVATSDATVATASLGADVYGNRFVNLQGLKAGTVDVSITNAAGTVFKVGSVTVAVPVIASLTATPEKSTVPAGEKAVIKLTALTATGTPVPNGTYTLSASNWSTSVATTSVVTGAHKFVDGVATIEVWAPATPGPMTLNLVLGTNAVLATALQGSTLTASVAVSAAASATAATTAQAASVAALQQQLATLSQSISALSVSLLGQIKALNAKLKKLSTALAKRG